MWERILQTNERDSNVRWYDIVMEHDRMSGRMCCDHCETWNKYGWACPYPGIASTRVKGACWSVRTTKQHQSTNKRINDRVTMIWWSIREEMDKNKRLREKLTRLLSTCPKIDDLKLLTEVGRDPLGDFSNDAQHQQTWSSRPNNMMPSKEIRKVLGWSVWSAVKWSLIFANKWLPSY